MCEKRVRHMRKNFLKIAKWSSCVYFTFLFVFYIYSFSEPKKTHTPTHEIFKFKNKKHDLAPHTWICFLKKKKKNPKFCMFFFRLKFYSKFFTLFLFKPYIYGRFMYRFIYIWFVNDFFRRAQHIGKSKTKFLSL